MVFTRKDGDFHGRTVSLPEGIFCEDSPTVYNQPFGVTGSVICQTMGKETSVQNFPSHNTLEAKRHAGPLLRRDVGSFPKKSWWKFVGSCDPQKSLEGMARGLLFLCSFKEFVFFFLLGHFSLPYPD